MRRAEAVVMEIGCVSVRVFSLCLLYLDNGDGEVVS